VQIAAGAISIEAACMDGTARACIAVISFAIALGSVSKGMRPAPGRCYIQCHLDASCAEVHATHAK
jgi:hypothetical protein